MQITFLIYGIIFIVIGFVFYRLAAKYEKDKWTYAILGVVAYLLGAFVVGFVFDTFIADIDQRPKTDWLWLVWFIMTLSISFLMYRYLENSWLREPLFAEKEEIFPSDRGEEETEN